MEVEEYSQEIQMNLEDVQELVEELELELLKSEDMSWEQEQKASKALEKMDEVFEQIEKIQKNAEGYSYEIWYYTDGKKFVFIDEGLFGNYRLLREIN